MVWCQAGDNPVSKPMMTLFSKAYMRGKGRARVNLTHWGRDEMADIFQTTFSNAFSGRKMYDFRFGFQWSLFLRVQLTLFQHWFRYWLVADQATSYYLDQCSLVYWRIYASLGLNELRMLAWGFDKHNFYNVGGFHNATISTEYRGDLTKRRMT